jgi:hypothetical protein
MGTLRVQPRAPTGPPQPQAPKAASGQGPPPRGHAPNFLTGAPGLWGLDDPLCGKLAKYHTRPLGLKGHSQWFSVATSNITKTKTTPLMTRFPPNHKGTLVNAVHDLLAPGNSTSHGLPVRVIFWQSDGSL